MNNQKKGAQSLVPHPQIHSSSDYDKFIILPENRRIYENHLNKVIKSLKIFNGLPYNPIIVAPDYTILDGQHRYKAAEKLNLEFYYIIAPQKMSYILLNNYRKNWNIADYIQHHSNFSDDYQYLLNFSDRHKIAPANSAALLGQIRGGRNTEKFKNGLFHCTTDRELNEKKAVFYNEFCQICHVKNVKPSSIFRSIRTCEVINAFFESKVIDMDIFLDKIATYCVSLRQFSSTSDMGNMFLSIYNKHRSKKYRYEELSHIINSKKINFSSIQEQHMKL